MLADVVTVRDVLWWLLVVTLTITAYWIGLIVGRLRGRRQALRESELTPAVPSVLAETLSHALERVRRGE